MPLFELTDEQVAALEHSTGAVLKPAEAPKPAPVPDNPSLAQEYADALFSHRGQGNAVLRQLKKQFRARGFDPDRALIGPIGHGSVKLEWDKQDER
jgi:hypothetical protein